MDIKSLVSIDTPLISFGTFSSSRVLGSTLTITNQTSRHHQFKLSICPDPFAQTSQELLSIFYPEDLPFAAENLILENAH